MNEVESFIAYLKTKYPNISDIVKSFKVCSKDKEHDRYLVDDETGCIDFDKLSEWVYPAGSAKQSADSLAVNDSKVFLIEFKTGDQTKGFYRYKHLISGVSGKISASDETMSCLYAEPFSGIPHPPIPQEFCLVVDSVSMGIDALGFTLAQLSVSENDAPNEIIKSIIPDLRECMAHPDHFSGINIWYSEIFSTYVEINRIVDFDMLQ